MKAGMAIDEFISEIHRLDSTKEDIVAGTQALRLTPSGELVITGDSEGRWEQYVVNDNAHDQIASRIGIPKQYYNRMRIEAPDLLQENVNHWFWNKPERRLVRILDGKCRAFLSDRYARIDHVDVLRAIEKPLSHLQAEFGARIESCEITDKKMFLKVVVPGIQADIGSIRQYHGQETGTYYGGQADVGDIVQAGFVLSNSETGQGAFSLQQMVFTVACKNGLIRGESLRKTHVGGRITDEGDRTVWSDATRQSDDATTLLAARDVVKAAVDETRFLALVARMRETVETEPTPEPTKTVERLAATYGLSDTEGQMVLSCFARDAGMNGLGQYGLINAVTRASQDIADYERATELEELGGVLLDVSGSAWNTLAGVA